jgi:quercetin dioxygenase-like cupin family protein
MNVRELELVQMWSDTDSAMRARFDFPLHAGTGTKTTAVVYFEIEPGEHLARHADSAEEILYVVDGTSASHSSPARSVSPRSSCPTPSTTRAMRP